MQRNCCSSDIHVQTEGFKGQEWYCIRKQKAFQSPKGGRNVNIWKASKFKKSKSETPSELLDWLKLLGVNLLGEWQASNQPSSLHVAHPWSHPLLHLLYLCKPRSSKISNLQIQKRPKSIPRMIVGQARVIWVQHCVCQCSDSFVPQRPHVWSMRRAEQHIAASNIPWNHNTRAPTLLHLTRHHLVVHRRLESSRLWDSTTWLSSWEFLSRTFQPPSRLRCLRSLTGRIESTRKIWTWICIKSNISVNCIIYIIYIYICDVSPLLHFTPIFPGVLAALEKKRFKVDGDIEELQPNSEVLPA